MRNPAPVIVTTFLLTTGASQAPKRTPDIHYTPTRQNVAEAMLKLAEVTKDDVVIDLGSGDGRLPVLAAQLYGARGVGVEIDSTLVAVSRQNAKDAGVSDRVTFIEGDLFTADISKATVVLLYLSTSVLRDLEPKLKRELRPGTRIVSHHFWIPGWPAEKTVRIDATELFLWRIPAGAAHAQPGGDTTAPRRFHRLRRDNGATPITQISQTPLARDPVASRLATPHPLAQD